ncbi:MAG: hypothetical protein ACQEXX_01600 [Bacillota bacterium]
MKRKDEWSYENDLLLAQTVLDHIENKSTQLEAFEEVAERLNRTAAACGFRWNSTVRKSYTEEIKLAKIKKATQAKEKHNQLQNNSKEIILRNSHVSEVTPFDPIIESLIQIKQEYIEMKQTIDVLQSQIVNLNNQIREKSQHVGTPSEDMQNLLQIIRRAEQLGMFEKLMPKEKPAG